MVCDLPVEALIHQCVSDINVLREKLIEGTSMGVGDGVMAECSFESTLGELLSDVCHVVVEVTTHHHCCLRILSEDVPYDVCHSLRSLLQVHLLTR